MWQRGTAFLGVPKYLMFRNFYNLLYGPLICKTLRVRNSSYLVRLPYFSNHYHHVVVTQAAAGIMTNLFHYKLSF